MSIFAPAFDVRLDPPAVSSGRAELKLNTGPIRIDQAGIDWGDAALQAYMADMQVGSSPVDYRIPNRMVHIPLFVGADENDDYSYAKGALMQKVGRLQQEGGWLQRQVGLYADIVNATLTFPDVWGEAAGVEPNVVLQLECLPDFYGDEIALDPLTYATSADAFTGLVTMPTHILFGPLKLAGAVARIRGNAPARCRIDLTNTATGTNYAYSVLWGLRGRYADAGGTARLGYMATDLTGVSGTAPFTGMMAASGLPLNTWTILLSTNIAALGGVPMTHRGSYRVWARVQSTTQPQLRFVWGVGSLAAPTYNEAVTLGPIVGQRQLVDLGEIRLDAPPMGAMQWYGAIQAYPDATSTIYIDQLLFQPLDDGGGRLTYNQNVPANLSTSGPSPPTTTVGNGSGAGTVAWSVSVPTFASAVLAANQTTQYLRATGFGFAIPSVANIIGIALTVGKTKGTGMNVADSSVATTSFPGVQLWSAGAPIGTDHAITNQWGTTTLPYGGLFDLWGAALTPAIVNAAGFGAQIAAANTAGSATGTIAVNAITMTVYWSLATGIAVPGDAVIYATSGSACEMRSEGMFRNDPTNGVYGEVSRVIGDLPRLPVSGLEARPVELFVRLTSGDLTPQTTDVVGPVAGAIQAYYRPSYLFPP